MANAIQGVTTVSGAPEAGASAPANQAPPAGTQGQGQLRGDTQLKDMAELQKKSPKLYNLMMEGIAMNIVKDMREHQEKLKELMRKAEEDANRH